MQNQWIFLVTIGGGAVLIIYLFWKEILQFFLKESFIYANMEYPSGRVKRELIYLEDKLAETGEFIYIKKPYMYKKTSRTMKGSRLYDYNVGNKFPKEDYVEQIETNLQLDYKHAKLKYADMWVGEDDWWHDLIKGAIPFFFGAILGAFLMMYMYTSGQIKCPVG